MHQRGESGVGNMCLRVAAAVGSSAAVLACLSVGAAAATPAAPGGRPNIVFIMADDLGYTDLACQGSGFYETPHVDRLAAGGMRLLNHHHCQNCAPTRAALLSGQYGVRTGVYTVGGIDRFDWRSRPLRPVDNVTSLPLDRETIADRLRAAGYATGMFGKWHLGLEGPFHPGARGFDEAIESSGRHFGFTTTPRVEHPDGRYLADFLTDRAVDFIRRHAGRPFFLYLPHFGVHSPFEAKPELVARFQGRNAVGGHGDPVYAAMIASVDESVGRVVAALAEAGVADDTVIIFTSDNGGVGGYEREGIARHKHVTDNHPLRSGKGSLYEGGVRVPFIVRWPGVVPAGTTCDTPTAHVDLFPTLLELAGGTPPRQPLDGESLVPLWRDPAAALARDAIFHHFPGYLGAGRGQWRTKPVSVVQQGDWKLMEFLEDGRIELYNLRDDLGEQTNLATAFPERAAALRARLAAWRDEVNAPLPTPNEPEPEGPPETPADRAPGESAPAGGLTVLGSGPGAGHYLSHRGTPVMLVGDSVTQGWMECGPNFDQIAYVDALADRGLTLLMLWAFKGTNAELQARDRRLGYDAPELWPWAGSPDERSFDLRTFNPEYFSRLRALVAHAERRGLVVLITVHDGWTKTSFAGHPFNEALGNGPLEDRRQYVELADVEHEMPDVFDPTWDRRRRNQHFQERFCARLIDELAPFSNVMYEMFNEGEWYDAGERRRHERHFLTFFRARCRNLLVSNSDGISGDTPHLDDAVDVVSLHPQGWVGKSKRFVTGFQTAPPRPYLYSEPVPEFDGDSPSLDDVQRSVWETTLAGAGWVNQNDPSFGWDSRTTIAGKAAARDAAYDIAGNCSRFFNRSGVRFWRMQPAGSLASTGVCLAAPGREYVVYAQSDAAFTVDLSDAAGTKLAVRWYHPHTGDFHGSDTTVAGGDVREFTPPFAGAAVLHLRRRGGGSRDQASP